MNAVIFLIWLKGVLFILRVNNSLYKNHVSSWVQECHQTITSTNANIHVIKCYYITSNICNLIFYRDIVIKGSENHFTVQYCPKDNPTHLPNKSFITHYSNTVNPSFESKAMITCLSILNSSVFVAWIEGRAVRSLLIKTGPLLMGQPKNKFDLKRTC